MRLEVAPIGELVGFYRVGFPLPVLSAEVTGIDRSDFIIMGWDPIGRGDFRDFCMIMAR